jgi:hypothetical protein
VIISGDTVTSRATDEWWELHRSGDMPATIRVMSTAEFTDLMVSRPAFIEMRHADDDTGFSRQIRSIHEVGDVFGPRIADDEAVVMVCWLHVLSLGER